MSVKKVARKFGLPVELLEDHSYTTVGKKLDNVDNQAGASKGDLHVFILDSEYQDITDYKNFVGTGVFYPNNQSQNTGRFYYFSPSENWKSKKALFDEIEELQNLIKSQE